MPVSWNVDPVGDTLRLRKYDTETGTIAVLFRDLPLEAKAALEYLADWATKLHQEKAELLDAYDVEVHAHNETRRVTTQLREEKTKYYDDYRAEVKAHNKTRWEIVRKTQVVLDKGIKLLQINKQLQTDIVELRRLRDSFPLTVGEQTDG